MSVEQQKPEVLVLLDVFEQFNVRYLIVGGFAVNRYGYNRTTGDLDLYLKDTKENRLNLIQAIEKLGYGRYDVLLDIQIVAGYCEILMDDGMYVDLMTDIPGLVQQNFDDYLEMATVDEINGIKVQFLHYDHLLVNKKATNRPKDQIDVLELERVNHKN